jgi:hypothetical protein
MGRAYDRSPSERMTCEIQTGVVGDPRAQNGAEVGSERADFVGPRFDRVLELDKTTRMASGEELHERFEAQQRD